jgi:zinc transport system permease protein
MPEFLLYALAAGILVATVAAPLGTLVVWQRLAYFGDTLAHSALLGTALGLMLHIDPWWTVFGVAIIVGAVLAALQNRPQLSADSLLGIISHGSLALGLVAISFSENRVDLNAYLFGDLLAVTREELVLMFAIAIIVGALLLRYWNRLLAMTVHAELAMVEGLPVARLRLLQLILLALLVAVAMKVVGVLLITALLIIPANIARPWARTPEQMAFLAIAAGVVSVIAGITFSICFDTPTGASVVLVAALAFIVSLGTRSWKTA